MPFVYTHQEYADIVHVYGLCDGNATAAVLAYQARFPNCRIPSAQVFSRAYWQISRSTVFGILRTFFFNFALLLSYSQVVDIKM